MAATTHATPAEFGAALRGAREACGIALEMIAGRTKISLRALSALEAGEFGKLPDRGFARMFLRQYLEFVGARTEEWLPTFEAAWQRFDVASQPRFVLPAVPNPNRRVGPWVAGLTLVAAGVAGVLLVAERPQGRTAVASTAVPSAVAAVAAPLPPPQPSPAQKSPEPPSAVLVVSTDATPCWVEVRVAGEKPTSRLLAAGSSWEVPAGGKEVDLVLGNAGAATVQYLGEVRPPAGLSGAVARIHLHGKAPVSPSQ